MFQETVIFDKPLSPSSLNMLSSLKHWLYLFIFEATQCKFLCSSEMPAIQVLIAWPQDSTNGSLELIERFQ